MHRLLIGRLTVTAVVTWALLLNSLHAWSALTPASSEALFHTIAERLLQQEIRISVTNLQVAPTNCYNASVHRVFQVAANICEAMNTNAYPLVFRPRFAARNGALYLDGFGEDNNADSVGAWLQGNTNAIPMVIGARRGLPNFNEYTFRTDMFVTRKLQLRRPDTNSLPSVTNQMYTMKLSNVVGVEAWNSYVNRYEQSSVIEVTNTITITFTNNTGRYQIAPATFVIGVQTNVSAWSGRLPQPDRGFILPLITNVVVLSNSVYRFRDDLFEQSGTNLYEDATTLSDPFYYPAWNLNISNHLVYIHRVDTNLIDFVVLRDQATIALTNLLKSAPSPSTQFGSVWGVARPPYGGVLAQIAFSRTTGPAGEWQEYGAFSGDRSRAAQKFDEFMLAEPTSPLVIETPFNPVARLVRIATWHANDPLVHYHAGDLTAYHSNTNVQAVKWQEKNLNFDPSSLTNINKAYSPWGSIGTLRSGGDPNSVNHIARDAGVTESDRWNFPTNEVPSACWLGRVHRGTPWQTVYLKAGAATRSDWLSQSGMLLNHPTNDWSLAAWLAAEWSTNSWDERFSVNTSATDQWGALMDGLVVVTNTLSDSEVGSGWQLQFTPQVVSSNSPQVELVVAAINRARTWQKGGYFPDVARLLATPELSTASPWLNLSAAQRYWGLSDEAYEALPAQLLSRLRADPIAVVSGAGDGLSLTFRSCEPGLYSVQSSTDLNSWAPVGDTQTVTGQTFTVELPLDSGRQFFRAVRHN